MAKKRKKKPPPDATAPQGKMRPADGAPGRPDDEGTRIDDGARHIFFSFKGELKGDLPDATETDFAGNLGLPAPGAPAPSDETSTVDAAGSQGEEAADATAADTRVEEAGAEAAPPGDSTPGKPPAAATNDDADRTATELHAEPAEGVRDHEQTRAGPVRGQDPAAQKIASQSRKAAGPAHLIPPHEAPQGASAAAKPVTSPAAAPPGAQADSYAGLPAIAPSGAKAEPPDDSAAAEAAASAKTARKATDAEPSATRPEAATTPEGAEPATHTDVRGEPFLPMLADATHTEIDARMFARREEPEGITETEIEENAQQPPPPPARTEPVRPPPKQPPRVTEVGEESAVGSETMLDATPRRPVPTRPDPEGARGRKAREAAATPKKPADETAAGSETLLDASAPRTRADETAAETLHDREKALERTPRKPADETAAGSETILDAAGAVRSAAGETPVDREGARVHDAQTRSQRPRARVRPPYAGPDADTVTRDPSATATGDGATSTDVTRDEGAPEAPSFHDAETASGPFDALGQETALPPQSPFDLPSDETQSLTGSTEEVPPAVSSPLEGPAPFAGAMFEAPSSAAAAEPGPEREEPPRLRRRRRSERREEPSAFRRLVAWAKQNLDPRDFLEIAGKALFERAQKLGEKVRTARRENRVSHTAQWWRKTLVEIGILYAIVIPIELAVSGGRLGSFGLHPHPYWLVVLPIAAARGLVAGLLAASVASILYAVGAAQAVTDAIFTFRSMTEPLLFFAVAFFAGELHDEGLLRRRKLDRRIGDLEERTEQLRQQRDVLTDANRELEKRIVDDSVQFGNLIQAARRIERAGRQEVFDLALEMAEEHCGAAASVLILLEDQSLDYLCHRGWPSDEVGKRLGLARKSAFVQRAVREGIAVNGLDPTEVAPPEGPLVVAPLFDAGGVVKALMCLDEIPLARLNESTVTVFLGIADWASAALGRLTRGGDAPAPRVAPLSVGPEVDIWLGTVGDLSKRLRIELSRCSRYGVATSFLTIQATEWKDATREGTDALDRFVLMHFTTGLRPSDGVYRFGYPGCYLLVLAGTSLKGAEVVRTRLERRISYAASPVGAIEILATGPDVEAPDLASLVGRVAKGFRDRSKLALDARCPVEIAERIEAEDLNAFLRRLKMETGLAVRNSFDLHVVGISAEASEKAGPGILARHVVEVGAQTLRPTDGVYMIGQYQCSIILPCTNGEEAATVAHRLATLVRARDPSAPYGQIETQVLGLGPNHPDAGSFLTALARRGKEASR